MVGFSGSKVRRKHGVRLHVGQRVLPQPKVAPVLREGRQVRRVSNRVQRLSTAQRVVLVVLVLAVEESAYKPGNQLTTEAQ